jgi:hypothetical protein
LKVGDVTECTTGNEGPKSSYYLSDNNDEYGKWAEVTVVKKIVDNDEEDAIYYETARRYLETGKTTIRRSQSKQAKYLCVNGPKAGKYLTAYGEKSDDDYGVYNSGTRQGRKDKFPSAVLVHMPSITSAFNKRHL